MHRLTPTPTPPLVALVEHDPSLRRALRAALEPAGFSVAEHPSAAAALGDATPAPDVVCLDLAPGDIDGLEVLRLFLGRDPDLPIIVVGDRAAEAPSIRAGAYDHLARPVAVDRLLASVRRAADRRHLALRVRHLSRELDEGRGRAGLIGQSAPMRALAAQTERAIDADHTLCISGETGTGKELLARTIHERGPRRAGPFVTIDCASITPALQEAELFGRERAGAAAQRGCLERAHGGTLFLDEISLLALPVQAALARTLAERAFRRTGGSTALLLGARVVASTTRRLDEEVRAGRLREDLARLLSAHPVRVPPLRERIEDVPVLAAHFMTQLRRDHGLTAERLRPDAMDALVHHAFPGNVRELRNVIHRAMLACDGRELRREHLPPSLGEAGVTMAPPARVPAGPVAAAGPEDAAPVPGDEAVVPLAELERREIIKALSRTRGNVTRAAVQLGIGRATLYRRLAELELDVPGVGRIGRARAEAPVAANANGTSLEHDADRVRAET